MLNVYRGFVEESKFLRVKVELLLIAKDGMGSLTGFTRP